MDHSQQPAAFPEVEIVKVWRPFDGKPGMFVVSARDGDRTKCQPIPDTAATAMNGCRKAYFHGWWSSTVGWSIGRRVADHRGW